jgi:hypothetical protein
MSCECYPPEKNYPAYLRKGCTGPGNCWVMAESKALRTPEGRAAAQAAYRAEFMKACDRSEQKPEQRDVMSRLQRIGVPANEMFLAIANDKPTEAMRMAQLWWKGDKHTFPALVMAGDVGQGKTVAAAWCALEWARNHPWNSLPTGSNDSPCAWIDGPGMRKLGAWGEEAQDLLASAATAQLTVLDDAGREGDRRAFEALSDMLMERLDRNRVTIVSSNVKGEMFRARYGMALADRLRTRAVIVSSKGASMRGAA